MVAIPNRLADELFRESALRQAPEIRRYLPISLYMPGIITSPDMPDDTVHQIRGAYHRVRQRPRIGMYETVDGTVPVELDPSNSPYLGVTEFERYNGRARPKRIGINRKVRGRKAGRVAEHELMHAVSTPLLDYMDVGHHTRTLIMESYAEFGGIKADPRGKGEILTTTPYTPSVKFGMYVDKFYRSTDGASGYEAFIRDIQRNRSARRTLQHLGSNIKEAMARGEDPIRATEKDYQREMAAVRKAA